MTSVTRLTAVYPGTFDPMTLGHEDLMRRASGLFERLILAVAVGHHKRTMFTIAERLEIATELAAKYPNVEVMAFRGLLRFDDELAKTEAADFVAATLVGRLRAKTGTLDDVIALSGYVLHRSWQQHELDARVLTQNAANALDQHVADSVGKIDLMLLAVVDELERELGSGGLDDAAMKALAERQLRLVVPEK